MLLFEPWNETPFFWAVLSQSTIPLHACISSYFLLFCIIDDVCSFALLNYSLHSKEAITLIIIINLKRCPPAVILYFVYFHILAFKFPATGSNSKPLSAKILLSHDNLSSQPLTLVSYRLQSKGGALRCDLLSGPAAEGSRGNKVLSPGKWGCVVRGDFPKASTPSHYCRRPNEVWLIPYSWVD